MNLSSAFSGFIKKVLNPHMKMINENSNCDNEDVFRKLPEDVVDCIVTFLSLKDLVKMSLVSISWRNRWKTCPNLDFDFHFIYPEAETSPHPMSKQKQLGYAKWVNQILASHQGDSIELFRILSPLHEEYKAYVDQWIMSALQKHVRILVLIDMPRYKDEHGHISRNYILPSWFSLKDALFLKHLTLGNIRLGSFEVSCSNHLMSLTLDGVFISDVWVHHMLQNCTHLRRLALLRCTSLSISKLVIPRHIQLQHLSLFNGLKYLRTVEIEGCQTLKSFEFPLKIIKGFSFDKFRNLINLSLLYESSTTGFATLDGVLTRLGLDLPSLAQLHLHFGNHCCLDGLYSGVIQTTFCQLRFLSLSGFEGSVTEQLTRQVGFLLRMSPVLHTLELRGCFMPLPFDLQISKRCFKSKETHQNLKVVRMYGFEHCQTTVDLVVYLLEISVSLETLQIERGKQSYMGDDKWTDDAKQELKSSSEVIFEWLRTHISSSTKLVL